MTRYLSCLKKKDVVLMTKRLSCVLKKNVVLMTKRNWKRLDLKLMEGSASYALNKKYVIVRKKINSGVVGLLLPPSL